MIRGFQPICADSPKVLILGSMPSVVSLEKQQYYGFPHNRFWKIMEFYFQVELKDYAEKKRCIQNHNLALWDVIAACEREGSLDSHIRNVEVNDIAELLESYPSITSVICNGKKSFDLYMRHWKHLNVSVFSLPSTSNANRTIREEVLVERWVKALDQCLKNKD